MAKTLLLITLTTFLNSCYFPTDPNKIALQIASRHGMHKKIFHTSKFIITSYYKFTKHTQAKSIVVYIEGDGNAWVSKYKLSSNPTPRDPLALKLASLDQNDNVIYIARPCQFTPLALDQNCVPKYWSTARYSQEVVNSINQVIDKFKQDVSAQNIDLVGYSGGATIAGLIARQRNDINSLRTVAGNLDHDAVSDYHQTTKLHESLNLKDFAKNISHIPQLHYIGKNDQIIPTWVIKDFVKLVNNYQFNMNLCKTTNYKIFDNLDHYHGWEKIWSEIYHKIPRKNC